MFGFGDILAVLPFIPEDREGKGGDQVLLGPDGSHLELQFQRLPAGEHEGKGEEQPANKEDAHRQRSRYLQELQESVQTGPYLSVCKIEWEHRSCCNIQNKEKRSNELKIP